MCSGHVAYVQAQACNNLQQQIQTSKFENWFIAEAACACGGGHRVLFVGGEDVAAGLAFEASVMMLALMRLL